MEPCVIFFLWPTLILPLMETAFKHHIYLIKRCLINFYNLQCSIYLWYHLFSVKFLKYLTTVMVNNLLILCIQTEIHLHVSRVLMSCYKICRLWSGTVPFLSYSIWINATLFNLRPLFRVQKKVGFTACHSGKLLLVCTSPRVFSTNSQNFLMCSIDYSSSVIWIS